MLVREEVLPPLQLSVEAFIANEAIELCGHEWRLPQFPNAPCRGRRLRRWILLYQHLDNIES